MFSLPWKKTRVTDPSLVKLLDSTHPESASHVSLTCVPDFLPAFGRVPQTDEKSPVTFLLTLNSIKKVGVPAFIVTYDGETVGVIEAEKFPDIFVTLVRALDSMAWVHGTRSKGTLDLIIPEPERCHELLAEL
jgi:hypothetical protein